jgi:hypothetical protein
MASLAESITAMDEEFEEIKRKAEQGPEQIEQEPAAEQDVAEQPEHDAPEAEPAEGDDEPKEAQEAKPGNDPEMARYRKKAERMLQAADDYYRAGHNPAQALYERGLSLGFAPQQAAPEPQQAAPAAPADKPRASIKNILKNKKPTSSPIAAGGKSGSVALTKEAIERMSALELSQLTPDQCREAGIPVEE